eukprot:TRINITY_DN400_c0_g1_i1.p1 TRINITY_DN400_c0_g1~~TRINITY_DN400_c0_g1_i1.p1  ORF type:complete len:172 (+),score=23.15 TRINITY_DN400_c0_g1_i1:1-516(+)
MQRELDQTNATPMASKLRQLVNRVSEMEDLHRKREAHLNELVASAQSDAALDVASLKLRHQRMIDAKDQELREALQHFEELKQQLQQPAPVALPLPAQLPQTPPHRSPPPANLTPSRAAKLIADAAHDGIDPGLSWAKLSNGPPPKVLDAWMEPPREILTCPPKMLYHGVN